MKIGNGVFAIKLSHDALHLVLSSVYVSPFNRFSVDESAAHLHLGWVHLVEPVGTLVQVLIVLLDSVEKVFFAHLLQSCKVSLKVGIHKYLIGHQEIWSVLVWS